MSNSKKKMTVIVLSAAVMMLIFSLWIIWGNTALELNTYTVLSDEIPEEFNGFRIAHISDLHNTEIGEDNEKLLSLLAEAEPDIIAITGDIIDFRRTDIETALEFAGNAIRIAPCYYVPGNHEAAVSEYGELRSALAGIGVIILDNKRIELTHNGKNISLLGVDDPDFKADYLFDNAVPVMENQLQQVLDGNENYSILLSHRPELFDLYKQYGVKLALCGHAHGGQIRLPFIGGIFAPGQGLFPEYDSGFYRDGGTDMIVSRGIGNSTFPFRVNNRPEVILIELQSN